MESACWGRGAHSGNQFKKTGSSFLPVLANFSACGCAAEFPSPLLPARYAFVGEAQAGRPREVILGIFEQARNRTKVCPAPLFTRCGRPWKPGPPRAGVRTPVSAGERTQLVALLELPHTLPAAIVQALPNIYLRRQ